MKRYLTILINLNVHELFSNNVAGWSLLHVDSYGDLHSRMWEEGSEETFLHLLAVFDKGSKGCH